jgi:hypothetical protein
MKLGPADVSAVQHREPLHGTEQARSRDRSCPTVWRAVHYLAQALYRSSLTWPAVSEEGSLVMSKAAVTERCQ